jgi:hypothetical protein
LAGVFRRPFLVLPAVALHCRDEMPETPGGDGVSEPHDVFRDLNGVFEIPGKFFLTKS